MRVTIHDNELELMTGDITEQKTDAIVNAANGTLLGGGGVDGAIHRKAGKQLLAACKTVREETLNGSKLPTGEAVITEGFELAADYVIHTVGPVWNQGQNNAAALLQNCYENSLMMAAEKGLTRISFPSISTGVYHFPIDQAADIAITTITAYLKNHSFGRVVMVLFSEQDYQAYAQALEKITSSD